MPWPANTRETLALRRVDARNGPINSTRSAFNSVVTSNPSRRNAADMSAASLFGFGSRPMCV